MNEKSLPIKLAIVDDRPKILESLSDVFGKRKDVDVLFAAKDGAAMQERIAQVGPPDVLGLYHAAVGAPYKYRFDRRPGSTAQQHSCV